MPSLLNILSILAPLVVCLANLQSRKHIIWYYVLFGFITEILILSTKSLFDNDLALDILSNTFILFELIAIGFFYSFKFKVVWKKPIQFLTAIGALLFIYVTYKRDWQGINTIALSCFLLFYLILTTLGYLRMLRNLAHKHIENSSFFWFNTAFFIYSSSSLLIFLFADYLMKENQELFHALWQYVYKIVNIARYTLIGIGLGKLKRP
jgi:hypothetical protein